VLEPGLQDEVAAAAGCERVDGLRIRTGAPLDLAALVSLTEIAGDLDVGPTVAVDTIRLDALVRVTGAIRVHDNGALRGVFLPRLQSAGRVEVHDNPVLTTLSIPQLTGVDGSVEVADNNALELVGAGALSSIGGDIVLENSPSLNLLELGHLGRARTVRIEGAPKVPADVADALRATSPAP
jgi:hypothetical protein